ncbi:MAG: 4Fe-4S single cluster domain-containing protein [Pirellulaceae bacterium]|nr:4Fe-4S single cluster domain-containing protein [Pirellulaceae bacterium]
MMTDVTFLLSSRDYRPQSENVLRVGAIQTYSSVAGPGIRAVIWVTGCNRRCPGCIKPEYLSFDVGKMIAIEELAEIILNCQSISGVTFSGGEPFEQPLPLANLSRILKVNGLSVLAYSGYRLDALEADRPRFGCLLERLDWLIDGEFRQEHMGPLQYKGSANQRLLKRCDDGSFVEVSTDRIHDVQISLDQNQVRLTGFPNREFQKSFSESLERQGLILKPIDNDLNLHDETT